MGFYIDIFSVSKYPRLSCFVYEKKKSLSKWGYIKRFLKRFFFHFIFNEQKFTSLFICS